ASTASCFIATRPRRLAATPRRRLNRGHKLKDVDDAVTDDQFIACSVRHVLCGDWVKYFFRAGWKSLARFGVRNRFRSGSRADRSLAQGRLPSLIFLGYIRTLTRLDFRKLSDGDRGFALSIRDHAVGRPSDCVGAFWLSRNDSSDSE